MQQRKSLVRRALACLAAVGVVAAGALVAAEPTGAATPSAAYDSIPNPIPGNVASLGFEATSTKEFGDAVGLGAGGNLDNVRVLMSSWGCESGGWNTSDCTTTPGSTFSVPITLRLYNVVSGEPGSLITSKTQTFNIPYRPSKDDTNCTGGNAGKWFDGSTCFNGYATPITFDLSSPTLNVSGSVIWTVSYDTTHYGDSPVGEAASCYTESGGCGYDSLNVGTDSFGSTYAGTDLDPDGAILDSTWAGNYCDGGAGGVGTLRHDTSPGCWIGFRPAAEVNVIPVVAIPQITTASLTIAEGNAGAHTVNVPVNLTAASNNTVTVKWKTRSQTAKASTDFLASTGTVTFLPGEHSKTVPITVLGDATAENYEYFAVDFSAPTNATLSPPGTKITSTITLQNDDVPALKWANITATEGVAANMLIGLSKPYYQPITVTLNSLNQTAIAPGDYAAIVGTQIVFPAGSSAAIPVPVTVNADGVFPEVLEKFKVTGTSPSIVASVTRLVNISANNS